MLDKSLDLQAYPELLAAIQTEKVFANRQLLANHPSFCVPLYQSGKCFALIMLWEASFEQQSMYYQNLLSVVAGLAQSSLVRASQFFEAVSGDLYEQGTRIMTIAAFRETEALYSEMQEKHIMDFLLLDVECANLTDKQLDDQISRCTRTTDIVGKTESGDCHVLMLQATLQNYGLIEQRFQRAKLTCTLIGRSEAAHE